MHDLNSLRSRYIAINGNRPVSNNILNSIQNELELELPKDFRKIAEFYDGSGFNVIPLLSFASNKLTMNVVHETLRLRNAVQLPLNWLVLGEPPESLLLMDCSHDGKVLWVDSIDITNISSNSFKRQPDIWDSFSDFFDYLLEEEQADRDV